MTCPDCPAFWARDFVERAETHRLWCHPTKDDVRALRFEIASLGADVETAWLRSDVLRARMLLGHLHQAVLRAMTYLDDDLNDEVAV